MNKFARVIAAATFCLTLSLPMFANGQDCCCDCRPKRVKKKAFAWLTFKKKFAPSKKSA